VHDALLIEAPLEDLDHAVVETQRAMADASAAVLMKPITVATIQDYAHRRDRMPPKTTYFFPKPRTGFVFRDLG